MTENKRFTLDEDGIKDNQSPCCYIEYYKGVIPIVDLLNELAEENKKIKIQYDNLKAQRDEFYHGARENANRVGQLEKENKELKAFLTKLADSQGNIYHMNGRVYNIQEVI